MDICCWLDLLSRQNQNVEVFQLVTCSFHPKMMKSPKYWLGMWEMRFELQSVPTQREQLQQEEAAMSWGWGGREKPRFHPDSPTLRAKKSHPGWVLCTGVTGTEKNKSPERGEVQL